MAYNPISGFTLQVITQTGEVASDYYLKFYQANTTTPLSMATDSAGGTLLAKAKLSDSGFPISNPLDNSTVFIPHMNANYRLVVYTSEADADADNTAAAYVNVPFVSTLVGASAAGTAAYLDTGTAAGELPTNGDLGTAAQVDTGTGAANVPTNDDLGTAAYDDVQASPSDATVGAVLNNETTHIGGEINYTGANLNPNVFGGDGSGDIICHGVARSATQAWMFLSTSGIGLPASITVDGTFSISTYALATGVASGVGSSDMTLTLNSNKMTTILVSNLSGLTAGDVLLFRSESAASKITVNF